MFFVAFDVVVVVFVVFVFVVVAVVVVVVVAVVVVIVISAVFGFGFAALVGLRTQTFYCFVFMLVSLLYGQSPFAWLIIVLWLFLICFNNSSFFMNQLRVTEPTATAAAPLLL